MDKYNVSYVYIGQLERQMYDVRTDKFEDETYFEPVYQGSVQIYKIKKRIMSFWFWGTSNSDSYKIPFIQLCKFAPVLE